MAVVGGPGAMGGALLGAVLVTVANDQLQTWLPLLLGQGGSYETVVFGALLVLVLQFAPAGLWPLLMGGGPGATGSWRGLGQSPMLPSRLRLSGAVLEAVGLRRVFGGLVAVADIGFVVSAGEIVGLIGPNGAGKSTVFNLLTGVLAPSAGVVRLGGVLVRRLSPQAVARRGVARTFQHVKLVGSMSVLENVALGAHLRGSTGRFERCCGWIGRRRHGCSARRGGSWSGWGWRRRHLGQRGVWRWGCSGWWRWRGRFVWTLWCCCWTSQRRVAVAREAGAGRAVGAAA